MKLAIFDFDGTITRSDSFIRFIYFSNGAVKAYWGFILLSPVLLLHLLRVLPNWITKQIVVTYYYRGWTVERFNALARKYAERDLNKIVRPQAIEKIHWHIKEGHHVVVVSASIENYLQEWCRTMRVDLLGTRLEIHDGRLTGKIAGKNCHGLEKIRRINEKYTLGDFDYIYAYGDTQGDLPLKAIAQEFYYRFFK